TGSGGLGDVILNQVAYGMEGVVAGAIWVAEHAIDVDQVYALLLRVAAPTGVRRLQTENVALGQPCRDCGASDLSHPQKITIEQKDTMKKHLISGSLAVATAMVVTGCTPPGGSDGQAGGNDSVLNIGWNEAF